MALDNRATERQRDSGQKGLAGGPMKRLAAFRLDQGGSVLVRFSQPPCCKAFCLVPESAAPVIIRPLDSHMTSDQD
jgi:hypothetical protein